VQVIGLVVLLVVREPADSSRVIGEERHQLLDLKARTIPTAKGMDILF
jgi:hypothetical protein